VPDRDDFLTVAQVATTLKLKQQTVKTEIGVASYLYALRHDEDDHEMSTCVDDDEFLAAARWMQRGWLDRAWCAGDILFRMSDQQMTALELRALLEPGSQN
jgi:hypothetical protein